MIKILTTYTPDIKTRAHFALHSAVRKGDGKSMKTIVRAFSSLFPSEQRQQSIRD